MSYEMFISTVGKLMELHGEGAVSSTSKPTDGETGVKVERADGYEPPIQESVWFSQHKHLMSINM